MIPRSFFIKEPSVLAPWPSCRDKSRETSTLTDLLILSARGVRHYGKRGKTLFKVVRYMTNDYLPVMLRMKAIKSYHITENDKFAKFITVLLICDVDYSRTVYFIQKLRNQCTMK